MAPKLLDALPYRRVWERIRAASERMACGVNWSALVLWTVSSCVRLRRTKASAPDDHHHARTDRGRSFWRRACDCVIDEPDPDYHFTDDEVDAFSVLLVARGCPPEIAAGLAGRLLARLAQHGTKVVLGLPAGDVVITAEEARGVIGRDLRGTGGERPT